MSDTGKRGISGSTVKAVGIITMLIDHVALALIGRVLIIGDYSDRLYNILHSMRMIGRLSFPIFCFMMVEGFGKTRSKIKYAMRLGIFALISEIPFDLAFGARVVEFKYQNVFFTLFLAMMAMCCYDFIEKKRLPEAVKWLLCGVTLAVFWEAAELLRTDYAGMGVLAISAMYFLRRSKLIAFVGGWLVLALMDEFEIPAIFALIPIAMYNGERGLKLKYFFYIFYPAHFLLLWLISFLMGMAWIPVT